VPDFLVFLNSSSIHAFNLTLFFVPISYNRLLANYILFYNIMAYQVRNFNKNTLFLRFSIDMDNNNSPYSSLRRNMKCGPLTVYTVVKDGILIFKLK
jgi:hypothetical protein